MSRCLHGLLLLILSLASFAASAADGVLIPAPNAVDMVHDAKRGLVYISTSDGKILRYKISTASFLTPFVPSPTANLAGIDLTPANSRIAVADRDSSDTELWVFEINPDTGKATKLKAKKDWYEGGMFTLAYAYNGDLYTTSLFEGSGWVRMRKFSAARSRYSTWIAQVRLGTMLAASSDRKTIAFAEASTSDGAWGLVDVPTGQIVRREGYEDGTSAFNFEIATDALGTTFAILTGFGASIYDAEYQHFKTIGDAWDMPLGAAFQPSQSRAYFPILSTSKVWIFDTTNWAQIGMFDVGYAFGILDRGSFGPGRTRVSANGRYLMVRVGDGVRLIDLSAGLATPKPVATARRH